MASFRIAVVGCGRIANNHFEAIKKVEGLQLAAVADSVPERAKEAGEKYGVPAYFSYEEMLGKGDFDIVAITTPSGLHPEQGILAAKAGKHVVSEKPMAISLEGADKLIAECKKANVHLFVVKQNRLNAPIKLLKRSIDKGRFGRLFMVNSTVRWTRPQDYYDQAPWRGTWALDGGAFLNQASHYVDLIQWLAGSVESVSAKTATLARNIEAEDSGVAALKFKSGALGVMEVTMLTYPRNLEGSITILGEKGTVKVGGTAVNKIEHWEFADYDDDDKLVHASATNPPNVYGYGHEGYYRNVVAVLKGQAKPDTDGAEGRKSLELVMAIYKSAKTGESVSIPTE